MTGRIYRYFRGPLDYPFGYGLRYTRSSYSTATVTPLGRSTGDGIFIEAELANTSARSGDEVACGECYWHAAAIIRQAIRRAARSR